MATAKTDIARDGWVAVLVGAVSAATLTNTGATPLHYGAFTTGSPPADLEGMPVLDINEDLPINNLAGSETVYVYARQDGGQVSITQ